MTSLPLMRKPLTAIQTGFARRKQKRAREQLYKLYTTVWEVSAVS